MVAPTKDPLDMFCVQWASCSIVCVELASCLAAKIAKSLITEPKRRNVRSAVGWRELVLFESSVQDLPSCLVTSFLPKFSENVIRGGKEAIATETLRDA